MKRKLTDTALDLASLGLAATFWLSVVHLFFAPASTDARTDVNGIPPRARALLERQLASWESDGADSPAADELSLLRAANPEWDFMSRTFTVLALANLSLREPEERARYLTAMDRIIDDTLAVEAEQGAEHFLLPYWRRAPFVDPSARTLFVEGEVAMMMAARLMVEDRQELRPRLAARLARIIAQMERGPALSGESYPDECWTFCNAVALAAVRLSDAVTGEDHSGFLDRWSGRAREMLIDESTGLLVSEYTRDGTHLDGPEGSSIFLVAHCLQLVDPAFARDQYRRARELLAVEVAGFAYAREWPESSRALPDIDSGPVIPLVEASAGASGMAILGAAAFGDDPLLRGLLTSLDFAAFPIEDDSGLRYGASNRVGDAVVLYALVQGPLWARALERTGRSS